jgi:hypothetical protein
MVAPPKSLDGERAPQFALEPAAAWGKCYSIFLWPVGFMQKLMAANRDDVDF